jgi:hypothetical protein
MSNEKLRARDWFLGIMGLIIMAIIVIGLAAVFLSGALDAVVGDHP